MSIEIKTISIEIDGELISLSVDQARELSFQLAAIFRAPEITTTPWYVPYVPTIGPYEFWATSQDSGTIFFSESGDISEEAWDKL